MSADTTGTDTPDPRDVRAATEAMVVVKAGPGMFKIYSGETSIHTIDLAGPACSCRDFQYRWQKTGRQCKHIARVRMTLGVDPIPSGVTPDPVLEHQRASDYL